MADENVRNLVRRVRRTLQERGAAGAFLLQELDFAISSGTRVRPEAAPPSALPGDSDGKSLTDTELLAVLHSVFETYLITLPSVARGLNERLERRFGIEHCEIALDRSLLEDDEAAAGRVRLDLVVPSEPSDSLGAAVRRLGEIVHERTR